MRTLLIAASFCLLPLTSTRSVEAATWFDEEVKQQGVDNQAKANRDTNIQSQSTFKLTINRNGRTLTFDSLEEAEKSKDPEVRRHVARYKEREKRFQDEFQKTIDKMNRMMDRQIGGRDGKAPAKTYDDGLVFLLPFAKQSKALRDSYVEAVKAATDPKTKLQLSKDMNANSGADDLTLEFGSAKSAEAFRALLLKTLQQLVDAGKKPAVSKNDTSTVIEIADDVIAEKVRTDTEKLMRSAAEPPPGAHVPNLKIIAEKDGLIVVFPDPENKVEADALVKKLRLSAKELEKADEADDLPLGGKAEVGGGGDIEVQRDKLKKQRDRDTKRREDRKNKKLEGLDKVKERFERKNREKV